MKEDCSKCTWKNNPDNCSICVPNTEMSVYSEAECINCNSCPCVCADDNWDDSPGDKDTE